MPLLVGNLSCVHGVRLMFHRPWLGIQIIQFNRNITDQNSPLNFEQEGGEGKPAAMRGKSSDVSVKRKKREGSNELFAQEEELAIGFNALLAVEWPERLSQLPRDAWHLQLALSGKGRRAQLTPPDGYP